MTTKLLERAGNRRAKVAARWRVDWTLEKRWGDDPTAKPYEVLKGGGNLLVTNGANLLWSALIGSAITAFSNANARIGVGDGNGSVPTPAAGDTDLTAPTNKLRKAMDATYPIVTTNQVQFRSTFATTDANYQWREWGVFNAASGATSMLNHAGVDLGLKTSAAAWTFTVTLTLS